MIPAAAPKHSRGMAPPKHPGRKHGRVSPDSNARLTSRLLGSRQPFLVRRVSNVVMAQSSEEEGGRKAAAFLFPQVADQSPPLVEPLFTQPHALTQKKTADDGRNPSPAFLT